MEDSVKSNLYLLCGISCIALVGCHSEGVSTPIYTVTDLCRAAISAEFFTPIGIVDARSIDKSTVYVSYNRVTDGKFWDYYCTIDGNYIVWSSPGGRWRNNYQWDTKITYTISEPQKQLVIVRKFPDSSYDRKVFSHYEMTGKKLIQEMTDHDMRAAIKALSKDVESGKLELALEIPIAKGGEIVTLDKSSLHLKYQENSYSVIKPANFNEEIKEEVLKRFDYTSKISLDEFNFAIDALTISIASKTIEELDSLVFISPRENGLGVIGADVNFLNKDLAWEKVFIPDIMKSSVTQKAHFDMTINNAIESLLFNDNES